MVEVGICKNYVTTFRIYIFLLELTGTQIQWDKYGTCGVFWEF
jgi:hypothetical protein